MGPVLQLAPHLGPLARGPIRSRANRVRVDLQALSTDVREHRDCDRQCSCAAIGAVGALDRLRVSATVSGKTDAGSDDSRRTVRRADLQLTIQLRGDDGDYERHDQTFDRQGIRLHRGERRERVLLSPVRLHGHTLRPAS